MKIITSLNILKSIFVKVIIRFDNCVIKSIEVDIIENFNFNIKIEDVIIIFKIEFSVIGEVEKVKTIIIISNTIIETVINLLKTRLI